MVDYFSTLTFLQKVKHLKRCRFIHRSEFSKVVGYLQTKKVAIIGCGSQGLNQGLNMRDSGIDVSYILRDESIVHKTVSYRNVLKHGFLVGTYENIVPSSDVVINLAPDKCHSEVVKRIQPLMKYGAFLGYSHGFHIVECGEQIRKDITVVMVAPKCPGTEVREEYCRGFGVPSLIAVHSENDPQHEGILLAMSWAESIGSHRAGVLETSFVAEVKSDLMGEQTILCGMLQIGSDLCFNKMVSNGIDASYAGKLIQYGWSVITESLKHGGITLMFDRLSNSSKIRVFDLSEKLKVLLRPLFEEHMNNIITGTFSQEIISDWKNNDVKLRKWREKNSFSNFEQAPVCQDYIDEQMYFDRCIFMVAMIRAGVELSFEIMVQCGISEELAYYESLHELPLIANTIARKRLNEMNLVISDTAEYGSYLFSDSASPVLSSFMSSNLTIEDLGMFVKDIKVDNINLYKVNHIIRNHPIEKIGKFLRSNMQDMKVVEVI
ncbi:ketol-acid reductoisomerase [Blochmannia endosymbiont of Polyrhachis (Hedomyrma) turneri]|uniref:ketol-acid reductoisomerase n=1 Tax=Blochmannia endosymbiont of Polyrhachis (Hedomyrma) turneri TaxID=1505596 RepID=UPI00061A858C|nr:ketol-acid reductoisomerase [Blochmannia endosymbiont of Polyrhachis (Hedomyrma) turneri]AKC60142.1 ketol-acid reductoisomerase [Blochmannia endosymbiont of Polyrhachis (Hedomyrma) turneri]